MPEHLTRNTFATAAALLAMCMGIAWADDDDDDAEPDTRGEEVIIIYDERSPEAQRGLEDPAFVTVVRIDERAGETTSVAEVLAESIGVHVRSLGGLGSFSSISVRGASAGHTVVFVDGVPLSRVATVSADIGRYDLASVAELELYRGGVPVDLGGAAMGGALNLITRVGRSPDGTRLHVSLGSGSFGARHARARWVDGTADGSTGYHLGLGYTGAEGDFEYFSDGGTSLNTSDDEFVDRSNNAYDQVDGVARYRHARTDLTLAGGTRFAWKNQGIPGSANVQATTTSLETFSQIADLSVTARRFGGVDDLVATGQTFASVERQHYYDADNQVGFGNQDRHYWTFGGGVSGALEFGLGERMRGALGAESRVDVFTETDALRVDEQRLAGNRVAAAATVSNEIAFDDTERLVMQLALRIDVMRTEPIEDSNDPIAIPTEMLSRSDVFPSPRAAARLRVSDGLVLKGSAGWYYRAPTLLELFGDRGFVAGNPSLESETGVSADLGLVIAPAGGLGPFDRIYAEVVGFARRPRDTIAFSTGGGVVAIAQNLGDARINGAEASVSARVARTATLSANYTLLDTEQVDTLPSFEGKSLPQRPRHQLYARIDVSRNVAGRLGGVWADLTYVDGNYLDSANLSRVPARQLVGVGIKVEPVANVLVGLEGKNLADQRVENIPLDPAPSPDLMEVPRAVADFFGYPLPGRAFYITLEWKR
jgi:iron complex outermembrane receptor protein